MPHLERSRDIPADRAGGLLVHRAEWMRSLELVQQIGLGVGLIHVDLDRFHQVNTRWGQSVGDAVLALLGPRLAARLPRDARLVVDGDAFLAMVPATDATGTRVLAESMLDAIRAPVTTDTAAVSVRASAGIAWQLPGEGTIDIVEHAFIACRRAKATAPGTVVRYEGSLGEEVARRLRAEDDLRAAVAEGQFRLAVQPEIDLADGRVVGVEALVRWQHPVEGLLAPARFLADAEAAGLMVMVGDWVLDEAIRLAARWRCARGGQPMRVWVNLSAEQLTDGESVCERVRAALASDEIVPQCIGFEVTESSLLEDLPSAVAMLTSLRGLGIEIALDDFGTGYSSLSYLRRLPVTAVKIDRQFVAGIGGSLADEAIVEAVIDLSHALGLRVIAEGIEEVSQAEALRRMGADQAQGYHFGRPAPPDDVETRFDLVWGGATAPGVTSTAIDQRADELPGYGSPRARLLLAALDTAHDSIIVTAASGSDVLGPPIVYVNAAFEAETGFRSRDVIGRTVDLLLPGAGTSDRGHDEAMNWFQRVHTEGRAATTEMANRRADGSTFLCEITLSPIADERGVHTHWLHVRRDLTQRRAAEGDRARFQGLIEQTTSLVYLAEGSGQVVYANAAMRKGLGIGPDDSLEGWTVRRMLSAEQLERVRTEVAPALAAHGLWRGEGDLVNTATGEVMELLTEAQLVQDPLRPGVTMLASVSRDMTEINALSRAATRRHELRTFVAELANRATHGAGDEVLEGLDAVLAALGVLLEADLVYLDAIDTDANLLRTLGRWTDPRVDHPETVPAEIPLDHLHAWVQHLEGVEVLLDGDDGGSDEPWRREVLAVFPHMVERSNRFAPLRVGGVLMGVLGLASIDAADEWTRDEIDTLQEVADTLANLLARKRAEAALRASEARLTAMLASVGDVLAVVDRDGWVRYANPRIGEVLGHPPVDVVGRHFLDFVHIDDHELAVERFAGSVAGVEQPPTQLRGMTAGGDAVWFDVDISEHEDPLIGGYMVSLRNVSQHRASAEAADRQVELERVVLQLSQWALEVEPADIIDGLHVHLGNLGRTLGSDTAFAALLDGDRVRNVAGWAAAEGDSRGYEFPSGDGEVPAIVARYRTLEPLVVTDIDDHDEPWAVEWRSFPVPDRSGLNVPLVSGGRCLGNVGVAMHREAREWQADEIALVRRVAETVSAVLVRQQVEDSLRLSETRLAALLDVAQTALDLDAPAFLDLLPAVCEGLGEMVGADHVYVDHFDQASQLLVNAACWSRTGADGLAPIIESVPFTDVPLWLERLRRAEPIVERDTCASSEPWAAEKRAVLGTERGMLAVPMTSAGELFGVLGVSMASSPRDWSPDEVTFVRILAETIAHVLERARLDAALRASEARFRLLSETAADVVLLTSAEGLITYASPSSVDLLGFSPEQLVGRRSTSLVHVDHVDEVSVSAAQQMTGRWSSELRLVRADGSVVWVASSTSAVLDPASGHPVEYRSSMRDITDRKRLEEELERQALHDPLTGLGNRILLQSRLEVAVARRGSDSHVAVLLADLDGFKDVNDTFGHATGDEVLRVVAARLRRLTRPMDTVARTGGDEFVLLCPETDVTSAAAIAQRVVEAIAMPVTVGAVTVQVGVSVGVAGRRGADTDPDTLLIEADHAMYAAKRSGRGRVGVAPSPSTVLG